MNLNDCPEVLRVDEVAALLRVDRKTAYSLIQAGDLPAVRLGRSIRVTRSALLRFLGLDDEDRAPTEGLRVLEGGGDG